MRTTSDLRLCRTCWLPRGPIDEDGLIQRCLCEIKTLKEAGRPDSWLLNGRAEDAGFKLCPVCASAAVNVRCRYSLIVCEPCSEVVVEFNEAARACVVPISRHSIVNGSFSDRRRPRKDIADFIDALRDVGRKWDLMNAWEKGLVGEICSEAGLDDADDIALEDYLAAASKRWASSQEALDAMLASWLADREASL